MMRVAARQLVVAPLAWPLFLVAMFMASLVFAAITPPFQAPDEFDHVKRAYMLGQGQILLRSVDGAPSGGEVDSGLVRYMEHFIPLKGVASRKLSSDEMLNAGSIRWEETSLFQSPVGTAYYFPLMYAPQAIGLSLGKAAGMSVGKSYRLARALELFTCFALLILAFRLYRPSAAVLALLALPMNLFLFGSAVLDPMATSVAFVGVAAFMRISVDRGATPTWVFAALCASVLLVCACRANMLPLLLLPFAAWWFTRDRRYLVAAVAITVFVLAWTLFTVKTAVYPSVGRNVDHAARLFHLLSHPGELLSILFATWTSSSRMSFYAVSFIGVLGWLDTPFQLSFYQFIWAMVVTILVVSFSLDGWRENRLARGTLLVACLGSLLMTFLALLVQWTDPASTTVDGVQGRYLMIPAICLFYTLTGDSRPNAGIGFYVGHVLLAALLGVGAYSTAGILVQRYHTSPTQVVGEVLTLKPSSPLTHNDKVTLHFTPAQEADPAPLRRLSIRFGTYMATHQGRAELRLWTQGGEKTSVPFDLSTLVDNDYREFVLDGKRYVGGEIVSLDGQGVSVWESHGDDNATSCVVMQERDGRSTQLTPGCPEP